MIMGIWAGIPSPYSIPPVQIEPIAFYTMENVSGLTPGSTIFDELGNYDATTPSAIQTLPGAIGNALSVGPWQSSGVGVIDTGLIRNPSKPIALSAFVRIPPVGQTYEETHSATSVVTFADGVGDPATFMYATIKAGWVGGSGVDAPLTLQVYMYGQFNVIPLPDGLTAGDYCHVVINASAMDASTLWVRAWFNGVRIIDRPGGNVSAISTTTSVKFGGKHLAGYGEIDHVKIFEAELTDGYVLGLYDEYVPPAPSITWYDVPLGGAGNAFIAGQFNNDSINLPGTIAGATKVRLVGTWEGTYFQGDLIIRGYTGGSSGSHDLTMSYSESFVAENWSGTIDVVIPIQPEAGDVDGQTGLYGFFLDGANIDTINIFDGVGTGITGINVKLQIDVPFTVGSGGGGSGTDPNLWSIDNFSLTAYPYNVDPFDVTTGSGDNSWLTSTTSRHAAIMVATPKALNVNLTDKQPALIEVQIENFSKLPGFESDSGAVGYFIAVGIDNVAMARATITGNGTYQLAVNWTTYSNTDIMNFYIDTTGRETLSVVDGFGQYPEKVKFDVTSLIIDDVTLEPRIWHRDNWTTGHSSEYGRWASETIYEVYNFGAGGRWDVVGTWAQGLRPVSIIIDFDRHGNTDEIEIRIHDAEERVIGQGYSYASGTVEIVIGPDSQYEFPEQINDLLYMTTFCNFGVPETYTIKSMVFTY